MRQQLLKQISGAALAIMLTLTFTQILVSAQGSADDERSEDSRESSANARRLEGVWDSQVTLRICQTGDPIGSLRGMNMFIRGGSVVGTNANPNPPTALGSWQYLGGRRYITAGRFFRFNPDGSFAGVTRVTRNITLSRGGNDFTGTGSAEVFDTNDNLIATGCNTETAKRVE